MSEAELRARLDAIEASLATILYLLTTDDDDEGVPGGDEYGQERDQGMPL